MYVKYDKPKTFIIIKFRYTYVENRRVIYQKLFHLWQNGRVFFAKDEIYYEQHYVQVIYCSIVLWSLNSCQLLQLCRTLSFIEQVKQITHVVAYISWLLFVTIYVEHTGFKKIMVIIKYDHYAIHDSHEVFRTSQWCVYTKRTSLSVHWVTRLSYQHRLD